MIDLRKNADLAEFVGVLLGDGSIGKYTSVVNGHTKTQYRVKVTGDATEDLPYFKSVLIPLIKRIFNKEPKLRFKRGERTVELLLFGPEVFDSLIRMGLVESPKKNRAVVPTFIEELGFERDFLRGFFDTDGCLVFDKQHKDKHYYPRLEMKIDSCQMRAQIVAMLERLEFNPRIAPQIGDIWRVQTNGMEKLERWIEEIGFKNPKHLSKQLFWKRFGYYVPGHTLQERQMLLAGSALFAARDSRKSSPLYG